MHFQIRGPAIRMVCILLFWHAIIHLPILGSSGGNAPVFALIIFWAPFYFVVYGLLAAGEYWFRGRSITVATPA